MLQETLENWKIYDSSYDPLDKWLSEGEQILRRSSSEEKLVSYKSFILEINCVNKLHLNEFILKSSSSHN